MEDRTLLALPEAELADLVNEAFKSHSSLLDLARSPLAWSGLIAPALVLAPEEPRADDRGRALRVLLAWAVSRLAPAPPRHPIGQPRPVSDSTWQEPNWWRYNLLRHRYVEPLHPDEFFEGGGRVETLMARMGIPSRDSFFRERGRAIREVTAILRDRLENLPSGEDLRRWAVNDLCRPLASDESARLLLEVAATFRGELPRRLLLEIAREEHPRSLEDSLERLVAGRLLRVSPGGAGLLLPEALRERFLNRQDPARQTRRHQRAAEFFLEQDQPLEAAWHLRLGGLPWEAAERIFTSQTELVNDRVSQGLLDILRGFKRKDLPPSQWCRLQLMLSRHLLREGDVVASMVACRRALHTAQEPVEQAMAYGQLGRLQLRQDIRLSRQHLKEAERLVPPGHPEEPEILADLAWQYLEIQEVEQAEALLERARDRLADAPLRVRAQVEEASALAASHGDRHREAEGLAREAVARHEAAGRLPAIARAHGSLGEVYRRTGALDQAVATLRHALELHRDLKSGGAVLRTLGRLGSALFLAGEPQAALPVLEEGLQLAQGGRDALQESVIRERLVGVRTALGDHEGAREDWLAGLTIARELGFHRGIERYLARRGESPAGREWEPQAGQAEDLSYLEGRLEALTMARSGAELSSGTLAEQLGWSRGAARRVLQDLCQQGRLVRVGRGRGTRFLSAEVETPGIPAEKAALSLAGREAGVATRELAQEAEISLATAKRVLVDLESRGLVRREGRGRGTRYSMKRSGA